MLEARLINRTRTVGPADLPFEIEFASTGEVITVRSDQTVIEALMENDVVIPSSCNQGSCGTCVMRVLDVTPIHRDVFLTDSEHAENDQFTPCCSRGVNRLVIDI
ncbi:2Fe-2S iron-sulfur cluster-binding protein [Paraburkholderia sp. MM5477-R1]|uniref:2Fe-2S iron-sulfur cluster-binding protein n=1 Tax=Paraburkholderia sp. MM5477-R1 TaxID=2991062 RepID=UPI003D220213